MDEKSKQDALLACSIGDIYWLKRALAGGKEEFLNQIVDSEGLTPLHIAAYQRNSLLIEYMTTHCKDINVNISSQCTGDTPLHLLVSTNAASTTPHGGNSLSDIIECAEILLNNGADYDKQNFTGQTPLHLAAKSGLTSIVELLIEQGADITITNHRQQTPNDMARLYGNHECCRMLSALHWARDKDYLLRQRLQTERQNYKEKELQKNIQASFKKQQAAIAYEEWLNSNNFSPTPPSTLHDVSSQTRLSCKTCSSTQSHDHHMTPNKKVIPKIQISLNQADHNTKPIGKPDRLYPYSNYPPTKYRTHSASTQRDHMTQRPRSCISAAGGRQRELNKGRKSGSTRAKSAPTRMATPILSTNTAIGPLVIHSNGYNKPTINNLQLQVSEKGQRQKTSSDKKNNGIVETKRRKEKRGHVISQGQEMNKKEQEENEKKEDKVKDKEEKIEKNSAECIIENEKERKEEEEEEDAGGSNTSIDGLTFHEVGQENDLSKLTSPTSERGEGGAGGMSLNPIEILHVLAERSSQQQQQRTSAQRHINKHKMSRQASMIKKPTDLVPIPEGEYVSSYSNIEDSQLFDTNFLYSLMPFAFNGEDGIEVEPLLPAPPPTSPHEPHPPSELHPLTNEPHLFKQAWDIVERPQTPLDCHTDVTTSIVPKLKMTQKIFSTNCTSTRVPLKTSVFEFGGNVNYNN